MKASTSNIAGFTLVAALVTCQVACVPAPGTALPDGEALKKHTLQMMSYPTLMFDGGKLRVHSLLVLALFLAL